MLFFKDLTQVEQLEERERLRDRLASLGEMAAAIAHELKNPLAGIEVMAGLLRRQVPDSPDAQSLLADIISEAKMANAIVVEMLEFVRPIRLQVERTVDRATCCTRRSRWPSARRRAATSRCTLRRRERRCRMIDGDQHQLCQVFTNLLTNAFEALDGRGHDRHHGVARAPRRTSPRAPGEPPAPSTVVVDVADDGPGVPPELTDRIFNPFFTTKPQGSGLGPGDRPEDRRRARRAHRRQISAGPGHAVPGHAAGDRPHDGQWFTETDRRGQAAWVEF